MYDPNFNGGVLSRFAYPQSDLGGILSAINQLLTPTKSLDKSAASNLLLALPQQATAAATNPSQVPPVNRAQAAPLGQAASGPPSTQSTLSQYANLAKNISNLFGTNLSGIDTGAISGAAAADQVAPAGASIFNPALTGAIPAVSSAAPAIAASAPSATVTVGAPSMLGWGGSGAAGAGGAAAAAAPAASALTPIVPTASYLSAPAAAGGSGAASAGMGALGGGLLAGGLALAPVLAGMLTPAVTENAQYYSNMANILNKGNASPLSPFVPVQNELANMIMSGQPTPYSQAQLNQWGIPQIVSGLNQASQHPLSGFANQTVSNRTPVRPF